MAMPASGDARDRLAASVKKLLNHVSLERLSVMEITEDADVSRQTFYRHFRDKYDLVNWCFDGLAKQCFEAMGVTHSLRDGLILKFDFIRNEKVFFAQAFRSTDNNSIKEHDYQFILEFYTGIIRKRTGKPLPDDLRFILELYCRGSIDMTVEWAVSGMEKDSVTLADDFIQALPPKLATLLLPALE